MQCKLLFSFLWRHWKLIELGLSKRLVHLHHALKSWLKLSKSCCFVLFFKTWCVVSTRYGLERLQDCWKRCLGWTGLGPSVIMRAPKFYIHHIHQAPYPRPYPSPSFPALSFLVVFVRSWEHFFTENLILLTSTGRLPQVKELTNNVTLQKCILELNNNTKIIV